ncbi:MAG: M48 family metallopeptidase [Thermodesulfobacteriota bacterium]
MIQFNFLLLCFLVLFLLRSATQFYLHGLNLNHLRQNGATVPAVFQDTVNQETLKKISDYTIDSDRFHMVDSLVHQGLYLLVLLSGFLPWLTKAIQALGIGLIVEGLIFFALLSLLANLSRVPFCLYDTFVIEERYGFNRMTLRMWVSDLLKSVIIQFLLGGLLLWLLLTLIIHGGEAWWVWGWMLVGGFELMMLWLYPVVIAPLFNKFEPIQNLELVERISDLMKRVGLRVRAVLKMDAGKRSKHTNAYFTGIGKAKRIVLFDTLLDSHPEDEILAVLAHEVGHWKKRHVLKQIILLEALSFAIFYVVSKLLKWPLLYQTFGFDEPTVYVGIFLIGAILSPLGYFAQPLESAISRRFEREADDFVLELTKTAEPMCRALKRLASDNLANLIPHRRYAWFYYSHPPLVERIERLSLQEKLIGR